MTITTFSPFRRTLTIQFSLRNIGYTVFVVFLFYLVLVLDSFSGVQQYLPQKMPSPIALSGLFFCIMLIAGRNLTYAARIQAEQHGTTNTLTPADTWRYRCGILLLLLLMLPLSLSLGKITVHLVTLANDPVIVSLDPGIKTVPRGSVLLRTLAFAPNLLLCLTSNRRHLLAEYHRDDRALHPQEDEEEQVSLAERFGLRLAFHPLDQEQYLATVAHWLGRPLDPATRQKALQYALAHGSRSARVAAQCAKHLR